ncbi:MAG: lecithin retinol acyltransferase family protein [Pikeienuella sp.]
MKHFECGEVISVPFAPLGLVTHVGISLGTSPATGEPEVLHNSKKRGGVHITTLREFAGGKPVTATGSAAPGGRNALLERAGKFSGRPYHVISFNCEHFVSDMLCQTTRSPQLQGFVAFGLFALALGAAR